MNLGNLLKSLYRIFLKGKTVKVGSGSVTFPEKSHQPNFDLIDEKKLDK